MNKDTIKGKAKQLEGKLQDIKGDLLNRPEDNIAGKMKKTEGKMQEGFGRVKSAVKKTMD